MRFSSASDPKHRYQQLTGAHGKVYEDLVGLYEYSELSYIKVNYAILDTRFKSNRDVQQLRTFSKFEVLQNIPLLKLKKKIIEHCVSVATLLVHHFLP